MRAAGVTLSIAIAALAASASLHAAGPPQIGPVGGVTTSGKPQAAPLTATLSTTRAGARRVVLTLQLRTALVCGEAGPTNIVVQLPAAARIPATLSKLSVLVGGHMAEALSVKSRRVTISPGRTPGMTCNSVTIGLLVIRFNHLAQLQNPASPGRYTVVVRRGTARYTAKLTISA